MATFEENPLRALWEKMERIEEKLDALMEFKEQEESGGVGWAAAYLGISEGALYQLTHKKKIKHSKPGKNLKFFKADLDDFLNETRVKTEAEVAEEALRDLRASRRRKT